MGSYTDTPLLTSVQQCVVNALAAGTTLTSAAETFNVHRVTIYRWMKTSKPFIDALHRGRAEFVLARRDDLYQLSNRALEILMAILDNPKASPAVLLRTAMFILQRPQLPKTGWSMPEPAPNPDGNKLLDSAIIEQDYDSLPGLCNIERDFQNEAENPAEPPEEPAVAAESTTSEPEPPSEEPAPTAAEATECNEMQHENEICDNVASAPGRPTVLHSCPVPPAVLEARQQHQTYLEILDLLKSVREFPLPKIKLDNEDAPDDPIAIEAERASLAEPAEKPAAGRIARPPKGQTPEIVP
jgi:hypothetical protein